MLLMHLLEESTLIASPVASGADGVLTALILWLVFVAELIAAIMIAIGLVLTVARLARIFFKVRIEGYEKARLTLARFLALALEFQLAADILETAISPSWTELGKLGAIAVIRTALNYFLAKEIKEEESAVSSEVA